MSIKISELPEGEDVFDGCCMPIVTNGETKKIYYSTLKEKLLAYVESQLADVASSGDYDDLSNKPTIPTVPSWALQPNKPSYSASEVHALPDNTVIPTKTSDLTNDSGFLTQHQDISGKQDKITASNKLAYSLISGTPTIPTKTSDLTNDSGFLTQHQDISGKQDKATLETDVAAKGFTKNTGTYSKPSGGIPKSDLASSVQTSLEKADSAIQPTHIITVKQDGTGDFTNLRLAVESITDASIDNPYIIEVYPGTYNVATYFTSAEILAHNVGIKLTDGMTLRGIGSRNDIVIYGELDSNTYDSTTRNYFSTLNMQGTCSLENVTVGAKKIRYAVHDDFGVPFRKRIVKNCKFYGSQLTSGSPARAYGQGDSYGCMSYFYNCDFDVEYIWHSHNVANAVEGSEVTLVNCKATAMRFDDYKPNNTMSSNIKLYNCEFGTLYVTTKGGTTDANNMVISGHGNKYSSVSAPTGFTHQLSPSVLSLDTLPIYNGGVQ